MRRRNFIKYAGTGLVASAVHPAWALKSLKPAVRRLTILHTNDFHSRIDPFPPGSGRNSLQGGVARKSTLIQQIREKEENLLLFDSGDVFQGTPYFNFFAGQLEMQIMELLQYDALTIGNHDFDGGIDNLAKQLEQVSFPVLCGNYNFTHTPMEGRTKPWHIFKKDALRIGVFGLGIELKGLVPKDLYAQTLYEDPISRANEYAKKLKVDEKCHLIVCLSHLGYQYAEDKVSDVTLAAASEHIDLILGGHTHTFLAAPTRVKNKTGKTVFVNQAGWGGIILGRLDFVFQKDAPVSLSYSENISVGQKNWLV
jgi:5'-nucleotidase